VGEKNWGRRLGFGCVDAFGLSGGIGCLDFGRPRGRYRMTSF
jgi:hypothetical protein